MKIKKKNHFIFFSYCPLHLENLISQKPLQLGASNFFFELLPFANFDRKLDISKTVTARSSKVGQLIEGNE